MFASRTEYKPLPEGDDEEQESEGRPTQPPSKQRWKDVLLCILLAATIALAVPKLFRWTSARSDVDHSYRSVPLPFDSASPLTESTVYGDTKPIWTRYDWWSPYSSPRASEAAAVDRAWDAILPAHGVVAVDRAWASAQQLPDTIRLPSDDSKGVYIVDAYHQLHCLTIMRRTFYEMARGEPLSHAATHTNHCFDSLRQYVMCGSPGDTLLYSWGRNITGDGQRRQCRDWRRLRDWAKEHTACYKDTEHPVPVLQHFGHCHDGTDGMELAPIAP